MDSLEGGQAFTVTRDGHGIGELIPLRHRRTFVPRAEFLAATAGVGPIDPDQFRADLDTLIEDEVVDPYAR